MEVDALFLTGAHHQPASIKVYQPFLLEEIKYMGKKGGSKKTFSRSDHISLLLTNVQQLHINYRIKACFFPQWHTFMICSPMIYEIYFV